MQEIFLSPPTYDIAVLIAAIILVTGTLVMLTKKRK